VTAGGCDKGPGGRASLAGWTGLVLAALLVLHAAGGALAAPPLTSAGGWQAWVTGGDPVLIAFGLARLAALAIAWYLLGVTVMGATLRACRAQRLAQLVDKVTVPAVRRLLATTMTMTVATSGLGALTAAAQVPGPDGAAGRGTTTVVIPEGPPTMGPTEPTEPPPTITMHRLPDADPGVEPVPDPEPEPVAPSSGVEPGPGPDARSPVPERWEVAPGECLWSISEAVLTRAWGRTPSEGEVAPYWRRLIEANRASLADRDNPDLVFPGQVFAVPAPTPASHLAETL
jgi:nucleoid-associated protein YgaU